jgi:predicted permease
VRQLVTEGLLVAVLAGLTGIALAGALLRAGVFFFVGMLPPTVALRVRFVPLDFDYRVFLFAFVVAGAATILFALVPALHATRLTLTDALRGQLSAAIRGSSLRKWLITSQVAVSLVLLIVAVTLVRNGTAIRATNLGLDTSGVISVRPGQADKALMQRTHSVLTAEPRLEQVQIAATSRPPLFGETPKSPLRHASGYVVSSYTFVSPEYFAMLGIPILHGRGFTPDEAAAQGPMAVVSAAGARALWPGDDPIGKTLRIHIPPIGPRVVADTMMVLRRSDDNAETIVVTVVGVAGDVVSGFVYQGIDPAHVYLPTSVTGSRAAALMVRARSTGVSADIVKSALLRVQPDPLTFDVLPIDEMVALQMFPLRAASWIGTLLSAVALALSISGLYGVLTYTFGQRIQEIGIRMALGASTAAVTRLVVAQAVRLAGLGTAVGLVFGYSVMKILSSVVRLDNVSVMDPIAFVIGVAFVAVAVAFASYGPARRAARVDPSLMLRAEG